MRYWIKFSKKGKQKYISHRDMHKVINRIIIRAQMPVAYSEGYNPHQKISFSSPLELGVESLAEYLDLELTKEMLPNKIVEILNANSTKGIEFYKAKEHVIGAPKLMAWIETADYIVTDIEDNKIDELKLAIGKILEREEIIVEKRRRRRVIKINIRSYIHNIELKDNQLSVRLQTGQRGNFKISQFTEIFNRISGFNLNSYRILKTEMYGQNLGQYIAPFELLNQLRN
ncbi:MAG: TIGR03936 family radical SAM-associated protein [Clostridia bacterium]